MRIKIEDFLDSNAKEILNMGNINKLFEVTIEKFDLTNKKVPVVIFIDGVDTVSHKFLSYEINGIEGNMIDILLLDYSSMYSYSVDSSVKLKHINEELNFHRDRFDFPVAPYIIQPPKSADRVKLFKNHCVEITLNNLMRKRVRRNLYKLSVPTSNIFKIEKLINIESMGQDSDRLTWDRYKRVSDYFSSESLNVMLINSFTPDIPKTIVVTLLSMLSKYINSRNVVGNNIAIVGCNSNLVGKYLNRLLLDLKATLTLYHSHSKLRVNEFEKFDAIISCIGSIGELKESQLLFIDDREKPLIVIDAGATIEDNKLLGDFPVELIDHPNIRYISWMSGLGKIAVRILTYNTLHVYSNILKVLDEHEIKGGLKYAN